MDLIDKLLGANGCTVDGTTGINPLTTLTEQIIDNQFITGLNSQNNFENQIFFHSMPTMEDQLKSTDVHPSHPLSLNQFNTSSTMNPFGIQQLHGQDVYQYNLFYQQHHQNMMMMQHQYFLQQNHFNANYDPSLGQFPPSIEENRIQASDFIHDVDVNVDTNLINQQYSSLFSSDVHPQEGASKEGYIQAWNGISEKLNIHYELDRNIYSFKEQNENDKSTDSTDQLFEKGMELFKSGNISEAILTFESFVKKNGVDNSDEGWRMLGLCNAENDEDKKAIACLNKAIDCDPYNLDALLALGTSYVNEQDSLRALETLKSWVIHNPRFQGVEIKPDEYSDGTMMDEVMQLMNSVINFAPNDIDALTVLGVLYNVSMDYPNAIDCLQKAVELQPDNYTILNKLAATTANANRSEEAIPIYMKALELRPNYARGWLNLGISHANMDNNQAAAQAYLKALRLNPAAKHVWGYLRVLFNCMDRLDLVEMCGKEDISLLESALLK